MSALVGIVAWFAIMFVASLTMGPERCDRCGSTNIGNFSCDEPCSECKDCGLIGGA
jgi:hypothetical protein